MPEAPTELVQLITTKLRGQLTEEMGEAPPEEMVKSMVSRVLNYSWDDITAYFAKEHHDDQTVPATPRRG